MAENEKINNISLDGGTLCLNFTNTVHDRKSATLSDYIQDPADLIAWAEKAGILDTKKANTLKAERADTKGALFLEETINLRELLYRMFYAISEGKNIVPTDLALFNKHLSQCFQYLVLEQEKSTYAEGWNLPPESFNLIMAPIVRDAYNLLLSNQLHRVKECPNCGWLFLDKTKNGKRRWCSMENCGSNVKALKWYHKHKQNK